MLGVWKVTEMKLGDIVLYHNWFYSEMNEINILR